MRIPPVPVSPGLCQSCRYARRIASARGSQFVRCSLSDSDPRFPRYPRLPVLACFGYTERDRTESKVD